MKLINYALVSAIKSENYLEALEILMEHFGLSDAERAGARHALVTRKDFLGLATKKDNGLMLRYNGQNYFWADDGSFASSNSWYGDDCFIVHHGLDETR